MKAIVYTKYGPPDVLQLKEAAKPEPKGDQVLVRIHAASINALDCRRFEKISFSGRLMEKALSKSEIKILGADIAGVVEAVGPAATQFRPGDEVFGISAGSLGAFAEYACAFQDNLAPKPAYLSFEAAAACPTAALTALQGLRDKGQIQPGQTVLINGASGGVGTFAVQLARLFGAQVTAVCSTRNLEIARLIGADLVIDYTKEDFLKMGKKYELIVAVNGHRSILDYRRALSPGGTCVVIGGSLSQIFQSMLLGPALSRLGDRKTGFMGISKINQQDLAYLGELLESGQIVPVIERCYPLSDVAAAIRHLVEGHATGKVVITVEHHNQGQTARQKHSSLTEDQGFWPSPPVSVSKIN